MMKPALLAAALLSGSAHLATAAVISWQTPSNITGASDVTLQGTYYGSWAPYNANAPSTPVNGVSFQGFSDLPSLNSAFDDGGGYWGPSTADANYNELLKYGAFVYSSESRGFSWGGMTPGHTYLVQLWISDPRNINSSRSAVISSGAGDLSAVLNYPADGSGPGQFIIGTFVAAANGSQSILIDPSQNGDPNGGSAQINLVQVRDLGVIPEPSCMALAGLGALGLLRQRRK
ncbi:PEP-CTERM sorting domain-containing protein [Haloferula sp. BvORR071]|uniref:PEP-CTERM sorting domain-containing protein n=1 Tax=Haloferula sp. BvORR071 TaxID=1396141 RepID=UPI000553F847|nr:PEP-CTERM sorting domain-containing protein [Haloferula sp. BvORR071]